MNEIRIRTMQEDEIEECAGIIRKGFGTVAEKFGLTKENCPTNGAFMGSERLRADFNKGKYMYVVEADSQMIGFMQLEIKSAVEAELEKLTVLLHYRHYGFGSRMLDFIKQKARELGIKKLTIGIIEDNMVLKEWYLNHGSQHDGTKDFAHLPFMVGFMSCKLYE